MPKRAGHLMERIASFSNLQEAFLRAARGRASESKVVKFRANLDERLQEMSAKLLDGTYKFGNYGFFYVFDPKKRLICAANFADRVAFHAIIRICHPIFDGFQIFDSYGSRRGKGTYKALDRACVFARRYTWFAKLDVCRYFDSIHHDTLLMQLGRMFKDPLLMRYFGDIINSYASRPGCGLPIGNLTSQYFANHYLTYADRYLKEDLKMPAIVRYMDDTLVFANQKDTLLQVSDLYKCFLADNLGLEIHQPVINRTCFGVPFLGYVVYGGMMRLNQRSRRRFRCKMSLLRNALEHNEISQKNYDLRSSCLEAFVKKADTEGFLRSLKGICL